MYNRPSRTSYLQALSIYLGGFAFGVFWLYALVAYPAYSIAPAVTLVIGILSVKFLEMPLGPNLGWLGQPPVLSFLLCILTAFLPSGYPWWVLNAGLPCFWAVYPVIDQFRGEYEATRDRAYKPNFIERLAIRFDQQKAVRRRHSREK